MHTTRSTAALHLEIPHLISLCFITSLDSLVAPEVLLIFAVAAISRTDL